jgi:hypothetical protein
MAVYSAVLIGTGYIGNPNVTVTEGNGAGTLNQLLSSVGNEKYVIDGMDLWSDNIDQLSQPIGLVQQNINGNQCSQLVVPQKPVTSIANVLPGVKLGNYPLTEDTRINYTVLPGATVRMTVNINKEVRNDFSLTAELIKAGGHSIKPDVLRELGYREPEEINEILNQKKKKAKTVNIQTCLEPEPKKQQPAPVKSDVSGKILLAGLLMTAGVMFVHFKTGGQAALTFIK